MNEVGIVVSRYYEDLKWIEDIKSNVDVYVYNRNGESPDMGVPHAVAWAKPKDVNDNLGGLDIKKCKANGINLKVIDIPDDPGFEASTYAYHMYSRYNKLNDYIVFVQAHPEIYVKDVISIFNSPQQIKHSFYRRANTEESSPAVCEYKPEAVIDFQPFSDTIVRCTPMNYNWSTYSSDYTQIPWLEFCKNMPGSTIDESNKWHPASSWDFGAGNQFIASKKAIQNNPAEHYKKLQDFANTYMDPSGDSRPWWQQLNQGPNIFEGIWPFVFIN